MIAAAVLALLIIAPSDYPTDPEDQDKLCEVIGEAPNLSIPPKDRLWFKETCSCAGEAGCGKLTSKRFGARLDAAKKAREEEEARRAEERRAAVARRKATARERAAFWKCSNSIGGGDCNALGEVLEKACRRQGLRVREWSNPKDECYGEY